MSQVTYELKDSLEYASKGEKQPATFIEIVAPSFKQMGSFTPIKQALTAALSEVTEGLDVNPVDDKDPEPITGPQVMQLMHRGSGDMTKVMLHAQQLFKSGVALIDGEEKLTIPLMDSMSLRDFEGLLGEYVANFIVPSLMDGM